MAVADTGPPKKRVRLSTRSKAPTGTSRTVEKKALTMTDDVGEAIAKHTIGEDAGYDRIQEAFTTDAAAKDAPSPDRLKGYVLGLIKNASRLDKSCSGLVHSVLASDWVGRDDSYVALYTSLLNSLVSAQGRYVGAILAMLVEKFSSVPRSSRRLPNHPIVGRPQIYARSHNAVNSVLQLVPSAGSTLLFSLSSEFPHSSSSRRAHTDFVENLVILTGYAPGLKAEVVALIMERLVKIDVQVQVDMEGLEEAEVEAGLAREAPAAPWNRDAGDETAADGDSESDADSVMSTESLGEEGRRVKELDENLAKMDAIMDILFRFYSPAFSKSSGTKQQQYHFDLLVNQFASIILPTYRSRHSQFLIFHFAQTSEYLADTFAGVCHHLTLDHTQPALLRQSSAAYLASFVARGAHVSTEVVRNVVQIIGVELDRLRENDESSVRRRVDPKRHRTFHAMVQALLYIFCFRWRDLTDDPAGDWDEQTPFIDDQEFQWEPSLKETLSRAIYSKLNPLKVCSPSVVNEFARVACHLRFMYIYPLLESNRRLQLSEFAMSMPLHSSPPSADTGGASFNAPGESPSPYHLDDYFPFDPYHLPISKRWLKGDYVEWQGLPTLGDGPAHENEDTDSDEAE